MRAGRKKQTPCGGSAEPFAPYESVRSDAGVPRSVEVDGLGRACLVEPCAPDLVGALVLRERERQRRPEAEIDVIELFERVDEPFGRDLRARALQRLRKGRS